VHDLHAAFMTCTHVSYGGNDGVSLQCAGERRSRRREERKQIAMNDAIELPAEQQDELAVDIGDAAVITRGQGGSGSDDKRYTYN
jgi:hypothetical protein